MKLILKTGLFAIAATLVGCGASETVDETLAVRPAKLVTIERASNVRTLNLPAVIQSARTSEMTFQVSGQVSELLVLEGQEVEQGEVVARLDDRDYRNNVVQARAQYEQAESDFQRAQRLIAQDAISQSVLEGRRTQRDVALAALDSAEKNLSDTELKAPFSGGISRVYVEQFQNIQAKELIADIQSDGVEAIVNIPADLIAYVPQFEPVGTVVILDAAPNTEIPTVFKEASGQADPNTQTYEASFSFTPPDNLLILPGMTATLQSGFEFSENVDPLLIPTGVSTPLSSIVAEGDDTFVWVVDTATMAVSKRIVKVGPGIDENVVVTSGLEGGETVVAAGGAFLHEGLIVRPWEPQ